MNRYINAGELLELYDIDLGGLETDKPWTIPLEVVKQNIKDMPSADVVEVRHAKDIGYEDSYGWKDVCSLCGCEFRVSKSANYCPNCGAKMDGESE